MPEPMIVAAVGAVKTAAEFMGIVKEAVVALEEMPKKGAIELARALDEIHKELQSIFDEVAGFNRLAFERSFEDNAEAVLSRLDSPQLLTHVRQSGGSCVMIGNIYDEHLDRKMFRLLKPALHERIEKVFMQLRNADAGLFSTMEQVCEYLRREAKLARDLALEDKWAESRERIRGAKSALDALSGDLENAMLLLIDVRNEAMKRAKITSLKGISPEG